MAFRRFCGFFPFCTRFVQPHLKFIQSGKAEKFEKNLPILFDILSNVIKFVILFSNFVAFSEYTNLSIVQNLYKITIVCSKLFKIVGQLLKNKLTWITCNSSISCVSSWTFAGDLMVSGRANSIRATLLNSAGI